MTSIVTAVIWCSLTPYRIVLLFQFTSLGAYTRCLLITYRVGTKAAHRQTGNEYRIIVAIAANEDCATGATRRGLALF